MRKRLLINSGFQLRYQSVILVSTFILISVELVSAQHTSDTVRIKTVEIYADKIIKEQAGKTITKIDSIAMIKALTSNLSELISQNTPIFIKEYGRGAMATASFRGTAPSHTQVLWNGISLNSPMLGMVDFSAIPVYFTDNVSLLHGSGPLSEKSGALGGVSNLKIPPTGKIDFQGDYSPALEVMEQKTNFSRLTWEIEKCNRRQGLFITTPTMTIPLFLTRFKM